MSYNYPFSTASEQTKRAVWDKGMPCKDDNGNTFDTSVWRWDLCGKVMKYSEHGNRNSKHGWEIDNIIPSSKGGTDDLNNLQPLNWKNNAAKGDSYPWPCP